MCEARTIRFVRQISNTKGMSNVELVYRDDSVDYRAGYAVYPGDASKFGKGGK